MVANRSLGNPTGRDENGGLRNRVYYGRRTEALGETLGQATVPYRACAPHFYPNNGNIASLQRFVHQATRSWFKWLNRRSQRARLDWERFEDLLEALPLPKARIVVSIWS
jgi:hypothetical protein